jgi:hypothetical protein
MRVQWYTYGEIGTKARKFGNALLPLVNAAFVGICANNRFFRFVAVLFLVCFLFVS